MSVEQQIIFARRVVGMAGAGVAPSADAVSAAREAVSLAAKQGIEIQKTDHALQRLQIGVLPTLQACREAVAEVTDVVSMRFATQQARATQADSFARPRSR